MKAKTTLFILFVGLALLTLPVQAQDATGDLLARINGLRASLGTHAYTVNGALNIAAQNHASWMAQTGQISHTQPDGSTPRTRAQAAGYASSWVSENIYMGTNASPATAFNWWSNSSIHYRGMTANHYYDIGIGAASANGQTAYVLVFGNPNTSVQVAPPIRVPESDPNNYRGEGSSLPANAGNAAVAPPPPSFIVGVDNYGNLMHEVQPGQTLGEIVLMYGYGWGDIQMVRDLNEMTEPEGRNLAVGQVLLVPPWEGTYTPTPPVGDSSSSAATESQVTEIPLATSDSSEETPLPEVEFTIVTLPPSTPIPGLASPTPLSTSTPVPSSTPTPVLTSTPVPPSATPTLTATSTPVLTSTPVPPSATPTLTTTVNATGWVAATFTPTPGAVAMAEPIGNDPAAGVSTENDITLISEDDPGEGGPPIVLLVAVAVQVLLLGAAGFEFWRRGRRA